MKYQTEHILKMNQKGFKIYVFTTTSKTIQIDNTKSLKSKHLNQNTFCQIY